jgi:hypothetical protein
VSDAEIEVAPFFTLYAEGRASPEDIHVFIEVCHESAEDGRSLAEFLGMTEEEFGVLALDFEILPQIAAARRGEGPLRVLVAKHYAEMRMNHPELTSHIWAISHWLTGKPPV